MQFIARMKEECNYLPYETFLNRTYSGAKSIEYFPSLSYTNRIKLAYNFPLLMTILLNLQPYSRTTEQLETPSRIFDIWIYLGNLFSTLGCISSQLRHYVRSVWIKHCRGPYIQFRIRNQHNIIKQQIYTRIRVSLVQVRHRWHTTRGCYSNLSAATYCINRTLQYGVNDDV